MWFSIDWTSTMHSTDISPFHAHRVESEFVFAASAAQVWQALTVDIDQWWALAVLPSGRMAMEAKAGGRLYEVSPEGSEVLWYTVSAVHPGKSLALWGYLSPPWSLSSLSNLTLQITPSEDGSGCTLTLIDVVQGLAEVKTASQLDQGWQFLLGHHLRRWVEQGFSRHA